MLTGVLTASLAARRPGEGEGLRRPPWLASRDVTENHDVALYLVLGLGPRDGAPENRVKNQKRRRAERLGLVGHAALGMAP